jgi:L-ascorbate 6-phosphate lactonase
MNDVPDELKRSLMEDVRRTIVPETSLAVWALGQSGFIFKDHRATILCVDPCLTDPVASVLPSWTRLYPTPVKAEELSAAALVVTHDHLDHLDPGTISGLKPDAVGAFVGPANACRHLRRLGVPQELIIQLDSSREVIVSGIRLSGVLAITNDPVNPDAEGIVIRFPDAPTVYHTGDTGFSALLAHVAKDRPAIYMPCINGRLGNMDSFEAAVLGAALRSRWAIPHHYDMFRDNLADPRDFIDAMRMLSPETTCVVLSPAQGTVFSTSTE